MTTLTGATPAATYKDLLQVSNSNAGIDATSRFVSDGEGTASVLKLSTTVVDIVSGFTLGGSLIAANSISLLQAADYAAMKTLLSLNNVDNTSDATKNAASATLTNKTLTAPVISTISNTGTVTLFTASDTVVGRATTDTLTNKTISFASNTITALPCEIGGACSDETTAITTGTAKLTFSMPFAMTVTNAFACVATAPTGSTIIIDINKAGTTIMSTNKLSIDASEFDSSTAATPPGITTSALAIGDKITVDIDQIGSTIAGAGLKVLLIGTRP